MASSNTTENATQFRACRCGEGDKNIWTPRSSDNPDKQIQNCPNCQVLKCGSLFLSSRGIGWTSWKKRWFILTRTSFVFYRSDPNSPPQKGSEANLALGGIDLNNSGSVIVKPEKKLLTMLFPDGRDGRNFTLKAETLEDLFEWKAALENALAQSPSPAHAVGQNGIFRSDIPDAVEATFDQWREKKPVKSLVVGRPILLALEDIDGAPSFLEKALQFIEQYGIKMEGILRQSADVEEVHRRVREYQQGKTEFSSDEDAHVIGDCIKHILRELPSSPVPATCCTALVEAYTSPAPHVPLPPSASGRVSPEPTRCVARIMLGEEWERKEQNKDVDSVNAVQQTEDSLNRENLVLGIDSENMKTEMQDLSSSPDKQSSRRAQLNPINKRSTRCQGSGSITITEEPATYGRNSASKKSSLKGGSVRKETQDAQSFPNRQLSQKQQQNTTNEETRSTSSALTGKSTELSQGTMSSACK